ncbi:MAG: PKD domain-containing protein [Thaumarchaeota archaeon]|nr:PKD domain-containing protein [Nitrososphaerota archaeon]
MEIRTRRGNSTILVILGVMVAILSTAPLAFGVADALNISVLCQNPDGSVAFSCSSTTTTTTTSSSTSTTSQSSSSTTKTTSTSSNPSTTTTTTSPVISPVASFTYSPTSPAAGSLVVFTSTVAQGSGHYVYSWNFGDGTTSNDANPSHAFQTAGTFLVKLVVTDLTQGYGSATASNNVGVSPTTQPPGSLSVAFNVYNTCTGYPAVGVLFQLSPNGYAQTVGTSGSVIFLINPGTYTGTATANWINTYTQTYTIQAPGTYQVPITPSAGCVVYNSSFGLLTGFNIPWFGEILGAIGGYFIAGALVAVGKKK